MTTLLGTGSDEAKLEAERRSRRAALDKWRVVNEGWLSAYQAGCIPFEGLVQGARASIDVLPDDIAIDVPGGGERLLGHIVRRALDEPCVPRKTKGGRPPWPDAFKRAARDLITLIAEREGAVVSRDPAGGGMSAFERAAEIYRGAGVRGVKAETVRDWYGKT